MKELDLFLKHAKRITKKAPDDQKVLQLVKLLDDGSAVVTDSHVLYLAKDVHNKEESTIRTTGQPADLGKYPEIYKLFPDNNPQYKETFNTKDLLKAVDWIHTTRKFSKEEKFPMCFHLNILSYKGVESSAEYELDTDNHYENKLYSNVEYWYDVLKMIIEFGYETVELLIYRNLWPFLLQTSDEEIKVLITPMRWEDSNVVEIKSGRRV